MKSLADAIFGSTINVDPALIEEYHARSQRKSDDEKWLKANKPAILSAMNDAGKYKADYGNYRVSVTVPDESKFDMDKVLEFLANDVAEEVFNRCTTVVVNEAELFTCVEDGIIDLEQLKEIAWVPKAGTSRLSVKQL